MDRKLKNNPAWSRSGRNHHRQTPEKHKAGLSVHRPLHALDDLPGDINWGTYVNSRLKDFLGSR